MAAPLESFDPYREEEPVSFHSQVCLCMSIYYVMLAVCRRPRAVAQPTNQPYLYLHMKQAAAHEEDFFGQGLKHLLHDSIDPHQVGRPGQPVCVCG